MTKLLAIWVLVAIAGHAAHAETVTEVVEGNVNNLIAQLPSADDIQQILSIGRDLIILVTSQGPNVIRIGDDLVVLRDTIVIYITDSLKNILSNLAVDIQTMPPILDIADVINQIFNQASPIVDKIVKSPLGNVQIVPPEVVKNAMNTVEQVAGQVVDVMMN